MQVRLLIPAFLVLFLVEAVMASSAQAQQSALSARVDRMERLISQQPLSELVLQMQQMQQELSDLRGQIELHEFQMQQLMAGRQAAPVSDAAAGQGASSESDDLVLGSVTGSGEGALLLPTDVSEEQVSEEKVYRAAFELLKDRDYPAAKAAFESVLAEYPDGNYSDNSLYWLGEIAYVTRNYPVAIGDFRSLIDQYPKSSKRPSAMLKLGYLYDESGDSDRAREMLERLIETFPDSAEAQLAGDRLKRLN